MVIGLSASTAADRNGSHRQADVHRHSTSPVPSGGTLNGLSLSHTSAIDPQSSTAVSAGTTVEVAPLSTSLSPHASSTAKSSHASSTTSSSSFSRATATPSTPSTPVDITTIPACVDKVSSCQEYSQESCVEYRHFMEDNCAKYCGFCGGSKPVCQDMRVDCALYGTETCQAYTDFRQQCLAYCDSC